jgi:hypothetical protein
VGYNIDEDGDKDSYIYEKLAVFIDFDRIIGFFVFCSVCTFGSAACG